MSATDSLPDVPRPLINLNAGPAALPRVVLQEASQAVLSFGSTGMSVLSISHRSPEFEAVLQQANDDVHALLGVSANEYAVLWIQGGASMQFHSVAANLAARARNLRQKFNPGETDTSRPIVADYLVTGTWSAKAAEAAEQAGVRVNVIADGRANKYMSVPPAVTWKVSASGMALYTYVCTNETVHGVELPEADYIAAAKRAGAILVADMSSNIISRPIDVREYGIIYAGVQKNLGPAGVTLVIVRRDLLVPLDDFPSGSPRPLPLMLDWQTHVDHDSLYNTPPVYAMYVTGRVLAWLRGKGGLKWITDVNAAKAQELYAALEAARHFRPLVDPAVQSRMNVVFRVVDDEGKPADSLDNKFVKFAETRGIVGLRGHRSVGGCRASLYNAVTIEDVRALIAVVREFDELL